MVLRGCSATRTVTKVLWTPRVGSIRLLGARRVSGREGGEFKPGRLCSSLRGRPRALSVIKLARSKEIILRSLGVLEPARSG